MIYKTNRIKQTRKYGRKNKRNMRGGFGEEEGGEWWKIILGFIFLVAILFLFAFGNIVKGGGTAEPQ